MRPAVELCELNRVGDRVWPGKPQATEPQHVADQVTTVAVHALTSFTGCRSRTLISFLIRRQTDWIKLIFLGFVSMPNYFVATFALGCPTDPGSRKHFDRAVIL